MVRQDYSSHSQNYFFMLGQEGWNFEYSRFTYNSELDRPPSSADESLFIKIAYPNIMKDFDGRPMEEVSDTIYKSGKNICSRMGEIVGSSPVLENFKKLEGNLREEILNKLSKEARNLFEQGLEYYQQFS